MSRIFSLLVISVAASFAFWSCGRRDCDKISHKIECRQPLDNDDYDAMIDYVRAAAEAQMPKLREARTFEDVERIDEEIKKKYPLTDVFMTAIYHDYTHLDEEQRQAMADIRKTTQEAFEK